MKVSVIVPVYNVGPFLSRCIKSITNQNYEDYELILVNDGSTDNSLEICEYYKKNDDNIILINQVNQGSGIARNAGLKVASGEYIYFCDPDDYITGDFFEKVNEVTNDYPDLVIFGYWNEYETKDKRNKVQSITFEKEEKFTQLEFREIFCELFKKNVLYTLWNKVYKKSYIDEFNIDFGNAPMGQDTRYNLDVYKEVRTVKISPDKFYHYIVSRDNSATSKYRENRIELKLEELKKLEKLVKTFNVKDESFIEKVKSDILIESCNHIVNSGLPFNKKQEEIVRILNLREFDNIFVENKYINVISNFLLRNKFTRLYLVSRRLYSQII